MKFWIAFYESYLSTVLVKEQEWCLNSTFIVNVSKTTWVLNCFCSAFKFTNCNKPLHQPLYILNFLKLKLEFLIGVQSSDPLNTKRFPILLLLWQAGCECSNRHLFQRTGLQKIFILCLEGMCNVCMVSPKQVRNTGRADFSWNISLPVHGKKGFYTSRLPKNEKIGGIFVFNSSELLSSLKKI